MAAVGHSHAGSTAIKSPRLVRLMPTATELWANKLTSADVCWCVFIFVRCVVDYFSQPSIALVASQALREKQANAAIALATARIGDGSVVAPTNGVADEAGSDDGTQGKKDSGTGGVEVGSVLMTPPREGRGVLRPGMKASPNAAGTVIPPSRGVRDVRVSTVSVWGGVCGNCCFRIILDYMSEKCASQSFFSSWFHLVCWRHEAIFVLFLCSLAKERWAVHSLFKFVRSMLLL